MKISELGGETALINLIRDRFGACAGGDLALGIGDDAALIRQGDKFLVVTTDLLIENTHFRMDITEPYLLGWKAVAVNISDVAAMGGTPTCAFISIGLPDVDVSVVEGIYEGLLDASNAFGSVIAGGDTVGSSLGIVINVTQLGTVEPEMAAKRSGASAGDAIVVTNSLGDSRAGLELLLKLGLDEARRAGALLVERHLKPEPRVAEARAAVGTGMVRSMMDLSDGLAGDLVKLCAASGVGARVQSDRIPVSRELYLAAERLDADPVRLAAAGGEDYELLITCAAQDSSEVISSDRVDGIEGKRDRGDCARPRSSACWPHWRGERYARKLGALLNMQKAVETRGPEATIALGEQLGKALRAGDAVALFGDLGAGKTTLTRGIARGMNLPNGVHSPTFTLIHEHLGETPLYHVDLYRLSGEEEVREIGVEEYIEGTGVTIIEWADRMGSMLPPERLDIDLRMTGDTTRKLTFRTDSLHDFGPWSKGYWAMLTLAIDSSGDMGALALAQDSPAPMRISLLHQNDPASQDRAQHPRASHRLRPLGQRPGRDCCFSWSGVVHWPAGWDYGCEDAGIVTREADCGRGHVGRHRSWSISGSIRRYLCYDPRSGRQSLLGSVRLIGDATPLGLYCLACG